MLTIKWQTRVRKTLPTNYWQKWMRTRYLPNLYFASAEVKTQSQESWFLCFTLTILFKPSAMRWTCAAAHTSIPCLQKIIFLNYWLNSMSVLFICFKLQIFAILSFSYASFEEKVKYMNGIQVNSVNLVVIFFPPSVSSFSLLCLSTVVFWILGPCLWISVVVFVLIFCLLSRTDVHKTMDRLNQGGRNSLLL